jgi:hypothetical protein
MKPIKIIYVPTILDLEEEVIIQRRMGNEARNMGEGVCNCLSPRNSRGYAIFRPNRKFSRLRIIFCPNHKIIE